MKPFALVELGSVFDGTITAACTVPAAAFRKLPPRVIKLFAFRRARAEACLRIKLCTMVDKCKLYKVRFQNHASSAAVRSHFDRLPLGKPGAAV